MFADSISENAVHGSDSDDNAAIEGAFHFSGRDTFYIYYHNNLSHCLIVSPAKGV